MRFFNFIDIRMEHLHVLAEDELEFEAIRLTRSKRGSCGLTFAHNGLATVRKRRETFDFRFAKTFKTSILSMTTWQSETSRKVDRT